MKKTYFVDNGVKGNFEEEFGHYIKSRISMLKKRWVLHESGIILLLRGTSDEMGDVYKKVLGPLGIEETANQVPENVVTEIYLVNNRDKTDLYDQCNPALFYGVSLLLIQKNEELFLKLTGNKADIDGFIQDNGFKTEGDASDLSPISHIRLVPEP